VSILTIAVAIGSLSILALITALLLVLKDAANKEAAAVIPECTRSLIRKAQGALPEEARTRFEEEWSAGFEEAIEKRPAWALVQAISLYRGARQISRELKPALASPGSGRPGWWTIAGGTARISRWAATARNSRSRLWFAKVVERFAAASSSFLENQWSSAVAAVVLGFLPLGLRLIFGVRLFSAVGAVVALVCLTVYWLVISGHRRR